jgi:sRNA-binding carbon storage regulator CsrA
MSGLQITRKLGEKVVVFIDGKELTLTVEEFRGNSVRLSFHGDREFEVYRQEIAEKALHRA